MASTAHHVSVQSAVSDGRETDRMLAMSLDSHRQGDLTEAEAGYRQILKIRPRHPEALHLLGVLLHQKGNGKEALDLIGRAVRLVPDHPVYRASLGEVCHSLGRSEEAIACYRHALRLNPNLPDVCFHMGNALRAMGKEKAAMDAYLRALSQDPSHVEARFNLAGIHLDRGRYMQAEAGFREVIAQKPGLAQAYLCAGIAAHRLHRNPEAVSSLREAISIRPDLPEAWFHLGCAVLDSGDPHQALEAFRKAVELNPESADAWFNLGEAHRIAGEKGHAAEGYRRALRLRQDFLEAWNNLGTVLKDAGDIDGAIDCHRRAIRIKPDLAEGYYNLGSALKAKGLLPEAAGCFRIALHMKPGYAEAHNNLGLALKFQGLLPEAIGQFRHTCRIKPDLAEARWNLSLTLLLNGEFQEGWQELEWRFRLAEWKSIYPHRLPHSRWDGRPAPGKTILVHDEQGLGDAIQFVRYLPLVKERCERVVFETRNSLTGLFHGLFGIDRIVVRHPDSGPSVACDMAVPLMSLPGIFGTTPDTVPGRTPYLFARPEKTAQWEKRLPQGCFRVGIVWAGRPEHPNDRNRSCDPERFGPLSQIAGVWVCGLQKGEACPSFLPANLGDAFEDFTDTAAAIQCLDLVISVDTSAAHLAGAMGKPVWVMLPYIPDWRWMMGREDTPWYPAMRLFRQRRPGDWEELFRRLEKALRDKARSKAGF